jgi:glutathione peroxidase
MVNGPETNPIYAFLKSKLPGDIAWNFEKFLVDKQGNVIARFKSKTTPDELRAEIDKLL